MLCSGPVNIVDLGEYAGLPASVVDNVPDGPGGQASSSGVFPPRHVHRAVYLGGGIGVVRSAVSFGPALARAA